MSVFTVTLPANKTYKDRRANFVRVYDGPAADVAGVLEIRERPDPDSPRTRVRRYAVAEITHRVSRGFWYGVTGRAQRPGRVFRLRKPLSEGADDRFVCLTGTHGLHDECTCEGYTAGHHCAHTQALRNLLKTPALTGHSG